MDDSFVSALRRHLGQEAKIIPGADGLEPVAFVPIDCALKRLTEFRTTLDRVEQPVQVLTADAFVAYWKRFSTEDSVIFADERTGTYTAVVDYHTAGNEPRFCRHTATYNVVPSLEWETWMGGDGAHMAQADFARFIEDNYVDVFEPSHGDMVAIATNLKAKKSVEFASATDLQTGGIQFLYQEKITGSTDKRQGSLKVPDKFVIAVPVLLGDARVKVDARLRYRIDDGKLLMWYDLHRPRHHLADAVRRASAAIRTALGSAPFFLGSMR